MLPFYHPTSIVALDDEPLFLESFAFHFGEDFICRTFKQPDEALSFFEETSRFQTASHEFFTSDTGLLDSIGTGPGDQFLRMDASTIARLMNDHDRFQQISLLVVDYAMPGMNGVDVCRRLKGHPAKKILLTGKAGEETAVKAFNEGIIDCFLMKQMADLPRVLDHEMRQLQRKYFTELTAPLQMAFSVHTDGIFNHPGFNEYFLKLHEARGVVEYYYRSDPSGILMATDDGDIMFLVIQNEETVVSGIEIARDQGAPDDLVKLLESRKVIPLFLGPDTSYGKHVADTWRNHLWPAHTIDGETALYCSLISGTDLTPELTGDIRTFASFRDALDAA